jgi:hypothetical protein
VKLGFEIVTGPHIVTSQQYLGSAIKNGFGLRKKSRSIDLKKSISIDKFSFKESSKTKYSWPYFKLQWRQESMANFNKRGNSG